MNVILHLTHYNTFAHLLIYSLRKYFFCIIAINLITANLPLYGQTINNKPVNDTSIVEKLLNESQQKKILKRTNKYQKQGFLEYSVDTIQYYQNHYIYNINQGAKYYWGTVKINPNIPETPTFKGAFKLKAYQKLITNIYQYYQNNGYPKIVLSKSAQISNDSINIFINLKPGALYVYDTLLMDSIGALSIQYIQNLCNIKPNKPFCLSEVKSIQRNINSNGLFYTDKPHIVFTSNNKVRIFLKTTPQKNNSFSGFIGLQPNQKNTSTLTGQITLDLNNAFHQGEAVKIDWKKTQPNTQLLDLNANYPFILNTPIGVNSNIYIDQQDSTFTNTKIDLGLNFYMATLGDLSPKIAYINTSNLNGYPIKSILYGLNYRLKNINSYTNPTKGYVFEIQSLVGNRQIISENNTISLRTDYFLKLNYYHPLNHHIIIYKNNSSGIICDSLKLSELNRIGGINTIRGFNENSIFTKNNFLNTFEYQYVLDNYSSLLAFYDFGIVYDINNQWNRLSSIGLGIKLNTRAGRLSIVFAVGKTKNKPFLINEGKIHIGYYTNF